MLPRQQGPDSPSCMCWTPACHALQHPAAPAKVPSYGNTFSCGERAVMLGGT